MNMQTAPAKNTPNFRGANPLVSCASYLDSRVLMNKAVLDISIEAPTVIMANNSTERQERLNRSLVLWLIAYTTPFVVLPFANRFAMKHIAKLTKFSQKESNLIQLSNKYLKNAEETKKGVELLSKELKTDFSTTIEKCGGDWEKLRQKLISAKSSVLSFDGITTAAPIGCIGFFNNAMTKKKTGQDGFSAEFEMADKETVEERAKEYKKTEFLRGGAFALSLLVLTLSPFAVKKGLSAKAAGKFSNFTKEHAHLLDYKDGIFMSRLWLLLIAITGYAGIIGASRNQTEVKDNALRAAFGLSAFFGGDVLIGSTLARLSDKYLKTDLLKKDCPKTLLNKIIPPTRKLEELKGRSKTIGATLFWVNLAALSAFMGFALVKMLNSMIKKDVQKDAGNIGKIAASQPRSLALDDFIKNVVNRHDIKKS